LAKHQNGSETTTFSQQNLSLLFLSSAILTKAMKMIVQAKQHFSSPFFMEFFIIGAWQIWKQRNNFIFDRGHPSFDSWKTLLRGS